MATASRGTAPALFAHADALMYHHVGARIRTAREQRGLSLAALAQLADLDEAEIAGIEQGRARAPAETLMAIARALGVRMGAFYGPDAPLPQEAQAGATEILGLPMREAAMVTQVFARISDPEKRQAVLDVMRAVADTALDGPARGPLRDRRS